MKICFFSFFLILCAALPSMGKDYVPENFAQGYVIEVDGKGAIYTVELPEDLYATVTRTDLGDVRVFNGVGEVVPHTIRKVNDDTALHGELHAVPFFPLKRERQGGFEDLSMQVTRSVDGAILKVQSLRDGGTVEPVVSGYLLDISSVTLPLTELDLSWRERGDGSILQITVEGSNNLIDWHRRVSRATLADLRFQDQVIKKNVVNLPGVRDKYLKILWLETGAGVELTKVSGRFRENDNSRSLKWLNAIGKSAPREGDKPELFFDIQHRMPISALRVRFPDDNSFAPLEIYSRRNNQQKWQKRCMETFYQLEVDNLRLESEGCRFRTVDDAFWRIVVVNDGAGLSGDNSSLQVSLGYHPHELSFVARGEPPFLLAYGSGLLTDADHPGGVDILETTGNGTKASSLVKQAALGRKVALGGESALQIPAKPVSWKTWILWIVLVAGVLLLVLMARSLILDMREKRK